MQQAGCRCDLAECARKLKAQLNVTITDDEMRYAHALFHTHANPDNMLRADGFRNLAVSPHVPAFQRNKAMISVQNVDEIVWDTYKFIYRFPWGSKQNTLNASFVPWM
jgi:hypothetical protein